MGVEDGQPQGLPLRRGSQGLFSQQSLMSVTTDTTNHENEVGGCVLARHMAAAWIPAYAGMTVGVVLVVRGGFSLEGESVLVGRGSGFPPTWE